MIAQNAPTNRVQCIIDCLVIMAEDISCFGMNGTRKKLDESHMNILKRMLETEFIWNGFIWRNSCVG